jgi:hypothetical protein
MIFSILTTDQKGAIAEAAIVLAATELRIGVSRPVAPEWHDLIFASENGSCEFSASGPPALEM